MSIRISGYWVKKRHFWESVKLAKMYAFRHHEVLKIVERRVAEYRRQDKSAWDYEREEYPKLVRDFQADPHFVEIQAFEKGHRYFIRWIDYMGGFGVDDMIGELLLPWELCAYDGRVDEGTITYDQADKMADWMDGLVNNGLFFYIPIIAKLDPTRAVIQDLWPPIIKDLRRAGTLMHDGMDSAPIPVFVDYDKRG